MDASRDTKKFDLVVFGATGFTGQFVVEEIARTEDEEGKLSWAVAGRSLTKLQRVLKQASKGAGKDLESTPIIIADVSSDESLQQMCKQARIVLNCVGPFQFYGEPVVKACVENKTHHIDICGEPVFLEDIQLRYNDIARAAGVYVMEACGFDSIPAEMGMVHIRDNFKGDLGYVEGFVKIITGPEGGRFNSGTWDSAVQGFASAPKLKAIRRQLFQNHVPKGPFKSPKRSSLFYNKQTEGWCIPFIGADRSIVSRSQRYNYEHRKERPVQFTAYQQLPHFMAVFFLAMLGIMFMVLVNFTWGRKLMNKYPYFTSLGIFDKNGPSRKQMDGTSFTVTLIGRGHKEKLTDINEPHTDKPTEKITARVMGPELGYVTTPICMIQAAYVILKEQEKLPEKGGVFTPGAAFAKTSLIERLNKHGVKFEILSR